MNKILMGITVPAVTLLLPAALAASAFACTGSSGPNANAVSVQVAPAINAPIAILSYGSANGTVRQAPSSSAVAEASASRHGSSHDKKGGTHCQPVHKNHKKHCAPRCEHGGTTSSHGSGTTSTAVSVQVAPVVNAPVAVLSNGSGNGSVAQAPASSARSYATSTRTSYHYHTSYGYHTSPSYRTGGHTGGYHSGGGAGGGHRVECRCPCSGGGLLSTITHTVTHAVTHLVSGLGL